METSNTFEKSAADTVVRDGVTAYVCTNKPHKQPVLASAVIGEEGGMLRMKSGAYRDPSTIYTI